MGILNITPDSFSDGGNYIETEEAIKRALKIVEEGADIIDIGAESSRPGCAPVSEEEELKRLIPVLEALKDKVKLPISIDTYKAKVAEEAIKRGEDERNRGEDRRKKEEKDGTFGGAQRAYLQYATRARHQSQRHRQRQQGQNLHRLLYPRRP